MKVISYTYENLLYCHRWLCASRVDLKPLHLYYKEIFIRDIYDFHMFQNYLVKISLVILLVEFP